MSDGLRLDWCSYQAARYAVEHWHYSRTMPRCPTRAVGVWEGEHFVGAVIFGMGAGRATDGRRFGLAQYFEVAELVRVALREHQAPTSRIVAVGLKLLRKQSPRLRLLISYADPRQGHIGTLYAALGWWYVGDTEPSKLYIDKAGHEHHPRHVSPRGWKRHYGKPQRALRPQDAREVVRLPGKHCYIKPLDVETAIRLQPLRKPHPRRAGSIAVDAPSAQDGEGGSSPTPALQT